MVQDGVKKVLAWRDRRGVEEVIPGQGNVLIKAATKYGLGEIFEYNYHNWLKFFEWAREVGYQGAKVDEVEGEEEEEEIEGKTEKDGQEKSYGELYDEVYDKELEQTNFYRLTVGDTWNLPKLNQF